MSAVIVLTPIVVASWPAIAAAVAGAAASMGFSVCGDQLHEDRQERKKTVETELDHSEILADGLSPGEKIVIQRDDVTIEFGRDERGRCTVCVTGSNLSKSALRKIGEDVAGRVTQQFAYHKLVSELKKRDYTVHHEEVLKDQSIRLRVSL